MISDFIVLSIFFSVVRILKNKEKNKLKNNKLESFVGKCSWKNGEVGLISLGKFEFRKFAFQTIKVGEFSTKLERLKVDPYRGGHTLNCTIRLTIDNLYNLYH